MRKDTVDGFIDNWDRPDGELGNGWIDAYDEHPKWWDQFKLVDGRPVTPNPDGGKILQCDCSGARAAFYRDFGPGYDQNIAASIVWSGIRPFEGSPLLHVNPEHDVFGIGAWPVAGLNGFLVGGVGRSPDTLVIYDFVPFIHDDRVPIRIELRSTGKEFTVWVSRTDASSPEMMRIGRVYRIPEGLIGSTMHGAAIDLNQDPKRPPNTPVILSPYRLRKCGAEEVKPDKSGEVKNILCFGDSNTWGYNPVTLSRFETDQRWCGAMRNALGEGYWVVEEGQPGRTVVLPDPVEGNKCGRDYLMPCLESHNPLDLVIIMLGTNDLKARFSLSTYEISMGISVLVSMIRQLGSGLYRYKKAPEVLLIAPPPIREIGYLGSMLRGGAEKSKDLARDIMVLANLWRCHFLDAGQLVNSSRIDGVHLDQEAHLILGRAAAEKVKEILK